MVKSYYIINEEGNAVSDYRSVRYLPQERMHLFSMGYEDQPNHAHWGPGVRNYCILHYVTHGKGWFNGCAVHAGQGFYIHAGEKQHYYADPTEGWNYFWIILSEALAEEFVLPLIEMNDSCIFKAKYARRLQAERQRIFAEKTPMQNMEALSVFFSVMSMHERDRPSLKSVPLAHLNSAKALIENCFGQRLSVREVAEKIAINDRYLYNLFMKYEGIPPKEYIDRFTIQTACSLLADSDLSITKIAVSLGFDDVCTFSKFFKRRTGHSPTDYRA